MRAGLKLIFTAFLPTCIEGLLGTRKLPANISQSNEPGKSPHRADDCGAAIKLTRTLVSGSAFKSKIPLWDFVEKVLTSNRP